MSKKSSFIQAVIFIGMQASGKSTFFKKKFADSHIRINLDMLKTRHREKKLIECCMDIGQSFVIDNMNLTKKDRLRYLPALKELKNIKIHGYIFNTLLEDALERNNGRGEKAVPEPALYKSFYSLEEPSFSEGFDELFYVRINNGEFTILEKPR